MTYIVAFLVLALPAVAFAQGIEPILVEFNSLLNNRIIPALFAVAIIFFMINAVRYFIIESTNEQGRAKARSFAIYGILAFVVLIAIWGLVNLVTTAFGITKFEDLCPDYLGTYCEDKGGGLATFDPTESVVTPTPIDVIVVGGEVCRQAFTQPIIDNPSNTVTEDNGKLRRYTGKAGDVVKSISEGKISDIQTSMKSDIEIVIVQITDDSGIVFTYVIDHDPTANKPSIGDMISTGDSIGTLKSYKVGALSFAPTAEISILDSTPLVDCATITGGGSLTGGATLQNVPVTANEFGVSNKETNVNSFEAVTKDTPVGSFKVGPTCYDNNGNLMDWCFWGDYTEITYTATNTNFTDLADQPQSAALCTEHFTTLRGIATSTSDQQAFLLYNDGSGTHNLIDITERDDSGNLINSPYSVSIDLDAVAAAQAFGTNHTIIHTHSLWALQDTFPTETVTERPPSPTDFLAACTTRDEIGIARHLVFDSVGAWRYNISPATCNVTNPRPRNTDLAIAEVCAVAASLSSNESRQVYFENKVEDATSLADSYFTDRQINRTSYENQLTNLNQGSFGASKFVTCRDDRWDRQNITVNRVGAVGFCTAN